MLKWIYIDQRMFNHLIDACIIIIAPRTLVFSICNKTTQRLSHYNKNTKWPFQDIIFYPLVFNSQLQILHKFIPKFGHHFTFIHKNNLALFFSNKHKLIWKHILQLINKQLKIKKIEKTLKLMLYIISVHGIILTNLWQIPLNQNPNNSKK